MLPFNSVLGLFWDMWSPLLSHVSLRFLALSNYVLLWPSSKERRMGQEQFPAGGEVRARRPWKGEIFWAENRQPQGLRALTVSQKGQTREGHSRARGPHSLPRRCASSATAVKNEAQLHAVLEAQTSHLPLVSRLVLIPGSDTTRPVGKSSAQWRNEGPAYNNTTMPKKGWAQRGRDAAKTTGLCFTSTPGSGVGSLERAGWFSTASRVLNFPWGNKAA